MQSIRMKNIHNIFKVGVDLSKNFVLIWLCGEFRLAKTGADSVDKIAQRPKTLPRSCLEVESTQDSSVWNFTFRWSMDANFGNRFSDNTTLHKLIGASIPAGCSHANIYPTLRSNETWSDRIQSRKFGILDIKFVQNLLASRKIGLSVDWITLQRLAWETPGVSMYSKQM